MFIGDDLKIRMSAEKQKGAPFAWSANSSSAETIRCQGW